MVPPALDAAQQAELKGAVQELPATAGIELANLYWQGVRHLVWERFGLRLCRSSCLNYPVSSTGQALQQLGFTFSVTRSAWSRRIKPSGRPSWLSMLP